jgi:hypothetical protein
MVEIQAEWLLGVPAARAGSAGCQKLRIQPG